MSLQLAAILDVPWNAALSALHHWQTAVASVWGLGILVLAYRSMIRWYREDAEDARRLAPKGDVDAIYVAMKEVKKVKREPRLKHFFTQVLFWLPIAGFHGGKKIGKILAYPVLLLADKAKSEAVASALNPPKDHVHRCSCGINLVPAGKSGVISAHEVEVHVEAKCKSCKEVIIADAVHTCSKATPSCKECGKRMIPDKVHDCEETAEAETEESHQDCPHCGDCMVADQVHVCSALEAQEVETETEYCDDCDKEYDRSEKHVAKHCVECKAKHCTRSGCA
jgi:hypothetical protein